MKLFFDMPGDRYYITDQHSTYFLTMTITAWMDVFTRKIYRDIIVDSLNYCVDNKGLEINAWVLMSNHLHLIGRTTQDNRMSDFLRDFKKFTSKKITSTIQEETESRRNWLLDKFSFEARQTGRADFYKLWRDDNHAINLDGNQIDVWQKINYIHDNPVRAGWVQAPEHYLHSSAIDYAGGKGLVKVCLL